MNTIKAAKAGAYAIAGAAAGMSYGHQFTLYSRSGLGLYSYVVPVVVDLLALLAAMVRNAEGATAKAKKTATWTLAAAGLGSVAANVAVAENAVQVAVGVGTVAAYLLAENFVAAMQHRVAVVMVAKADADAALAMAMAKAAADMATAVAEAVAANEQAVRAALAVEAAELVAEAERTTREAAAAERAARAEAERVAREVATAERLARLEAERVAMAEQVAKATVAKPVAKVAAKVASVATPRVANGQASATVAAILATGPDMATDDVILAAMAKEVEVSARTVRRVRLEMKMAAAAA